MGTFLLRRWQGPPPEVVTICGSSRFMDEIHSETRRLTLQGCLVISLGLFGHTEGLDIGTAEQPTPVKIMLDDLHKRKIDISDRIHVVNPARYIGTSTQSEIDYAKSKGITITYAVPMEEE